MVVSDQSVGYYLLNTDGMGGNRREENDNRRVASLECGNDIKNSRLLL
jgi:F420-dependent methylenetetrahydromethanopterin dehydrogenase